MGRLTYYAGLTPAEGLKFSASTAVYPLEESPSGARRDPGPTESLKWALASEGHEPDTQLFGANWLQSRVQNQFVTVRARKTGAIAVNEHADGLIDIVNQLGTPIQYIALRDSKGNLRQGHSVGVDDSASLEKTDPAKVGIVLAEFAQQQRLSPPDDMRQMRSRSIFDIRRTYYHRQYPTPMGMQGATSMKLRQA